MGWRELETRALLYALPVLFIFGLWIGSIVGHRARPAVLRALRLRQCLRRVQSRTASTPPRTADFSKLSVAAKFVGEQSLLLFPAAIVLMGAIALRAVVARQRRPAA